MTFAWKSLPKKKGKAHIYQDVLVMGSIYVIKYVDWKIMISAIKVRVVTKGHKIFEALTNTIKYGCIKKNCQWNEACAVEKWLPFPFGKTFPLA